MMFDDRKAIKEMLNSVLNACFECQYQQGQNLLRETVENSKIAYGAEAAAVIVALIMEMHEDAQSELLKVWQQLKASIKNRANTGETRLSRKHNPKVNRRSRCPHCVQ